MAIPEIDIHATDMSAALEQACPDDVPAATTPPKVPTSVRLPEHVYEQLQVLARERGMGHTQLMLQFILEGLAAAAKPSVMVPLADVQAALATLAARQTPAA